MKKILSVFVLATCLVPTSQSIASDATTERKFIPCALSDDIAVTYVDNKWVFKNQNDPTWNYVPGDNESEKKLLSGTGVVAHQVVDDGDMGVKLRCLFPSGQPQSAVEGDGFFMPPYDKPVIIMEKHMMASNHDYEAGELDGRKGFFAIPGPKRARAFFEDDPND